MTTQRVDLSTLKANRRKRGRTSEIDQALVDEMVSLEAGDAFPYPEATLYSDEYKSEAGSAIPIIMRDKSCDKSEAEAVFENRWISRFRQRATAGWKQAGLDTHEMDFVVLNDGRVFIGRK